MPVSPISSPFAALGLPLSLCDTLQAIGYETPSPVQVEAIPLLLAGRDLIAQAQTGTGKTAAFALPILATIEAGARAPRALVLAPTRELAIQVAEAFGRYGRDIKRLQVAAIYGGQDMRAQLRVLKGGTDIVVGTPGRLLDHLRRGSLQLGELRHLVLDEADEMLRMGFIDDVEAILAQCGEQRQTAMFSATQPPRIRQIADRFLRNPAQVRVQAETSPIEQSKWMVPNRSKLDALTRLLQAEQPEAAIVFVRTRAATVELAERINTLGHRAVAINGDLSQTARENAIRQLKKGRIDILVATDVAARGLDIDRITHVINYDMPHDIEAYQHRIGRTGRAGRSGRAILFVTPGEQRMLRSIERATRSTIPTLKLPTAEEIAARRLEQWKGTITTALRGTPPAQYVELVTELSVSTGASAEQLAATLAWLLHNTGTAPTVCATPAQRSEVASSTPVARVRNIEAPREQTPLERPVRERHTARPGARQDSTSSKGRRDGTPAVQYQRYRLAVGDDHGVRPGDIVGAIASEADIDGRHIGRIDIRNDHSVVELPAGMPRETFEHLQRVQIRGCTLGLSRMIESTPATRTTGRTKTPTRQNRGQRIASRQ